MAAGGPREPPLAVGSLGHRDKGTGREDCSSASLSWVFHSCGESGEPRSSAVSVRIANGYNIGNH